MRIRVMRGTHDLGVVEADTPLHAIMLVVMVPGHEREFDCVRHAGSMSAEVATSGFVYKAEACDD